MADKFYSNAKWSKIEDTKEEHPTEAHALGVCVQLFRHYGDPDRECEVRGRCTKSWVSVKKDGKKEEIVEGRVYEGKLEKV